MTNPRARQSAGNVVVTMPTNNSLTAAYHNHWAREGRIQRMKFARESQDPEIRARWVELAKKLHCIYMSEARAKTAHAKWLNREEPVAIPILDEKAA